MNNDFDSRSFVQCRYCQARVERVYGYCEHAATQLVNQIARWDRSTVLSTWASVARHIRLLRRGCRADVCWKSSMFVFHYIKRRRLVDDWDNKPPIISALLVVAVSGIVNCESQQQKVKSPFL